MSTKDKIQKGEVKEEQKIVSAKTSKTTSSKKKKTVSAPKKKAISSQKEKSKKSSEEEFGKKNVGEITDLTKTDQSNSLKEEHDKTPQESNEFNWDLVEKNVSVYNEEERKSLEKMYKETLGSLVENEVVEGEIVTLTSKDAIVDIGSKSEGVISLNEFRYNPDLKIGDKVEVLVHKREDKNGQLVLSHRKARTLKAWDNVNNACEKQEIVTGYVKCRTKGGMIVDVFGIEAFMPGSQIDVKPIRDYDVYVGKNMELKVLKINHEFKNVVVSHKALIEADLEEQKKEIISRLEKGQVLKGVVKNITSYGVFIDLGGVDGLIHITDLSWSRINHPNEIVKLDEEIKVVILDFDDEKSRIQLGLKQLTDHPWAALDSNLKVGDKVKGSVSVLADYGAFIELHPGVEGLLHVSEMSWSSHLRSAEDFMNIGDKLEVEVLSLDREDRKMSFGLKQLTPDPWTDISKKYPVGSKQKGKVINYTSFGVFVELNEGIDGLVHISDLSWTKKIKHPNEFVSVDQELEVVVLELNSEERKLSLGHKQIEDNPWDAYETIFHIDSIHEGEVIEELTNGFIVLFPQEKLEAFMPKRHAVKENGNLITKGEKTDFKILDFSKDSRKVIVSHTKTLANEKSDKVSDKKPSDLKSEKKSKPLKKKTVIEKTTLGDIDALNQLKTALDKKESEKTIKSKSKVTKKKVKEVKDKKEKKIVKKEDK